MGNVARKHVFIPKRRKVTEGGKRKVRAGVSEGSQEVLPTRVFDSQVGSYELFVAE